MKTLICRAAVLLLAGSAVTAFSVPAAAAETAPKAEYIYADSVCEDFVPLGTDMILLRAPETLGAVQVHIVQHSPERANLELYTFTANPEENPDALPYAFCAEPGDYTIEISAAVVSGSPLLRTYTKDFTIDNPDYSAADDTYSRTVYSFKLSEPKTASGKNSAAPKETALIDARSRGERVVSAEVQFQRYAGIRGDFNGDKRIDIMDAQLTLNEYAAAMVGKQTENPANAEQTALCDIDADGELGVSDAQFILQYYAMQITGKTPDWPV